jgi:hypothetical protein
VSRPSGARSKRGAEDPDPPQFPRIEFSGSPVSEKGLFSAFVYNRVAYSLIFPVLSVLLAVLALWLPLPLPWLDPRLP